MQAQTTKPAPSEEPKSPSSHDPVLTPEDEAFFRQVMARPEDGGAPGTKSGGDGNAVATSADGGAVAQDTTRDPEEIGKELGEEQRRASTSEDKGKEKGKEKQKESKEGEEAEKKTKRSSWGWLKRMGTKKKVFPLFLQIFDDAILMRIVFHRRPRTRKTQTRKNPNPNNQSHPIVPRKTKARTKTPVPKNNNQKQTTTCPKSSSN